VHWKPTFVDSEIYLCTEKYICALHLWVTMKYSLFNYKIQCKNFFDHLAGIDNARDTNLSGYEVFFWCSDRLLLQITTEMYYKFPQLCYYKPRQLCSKSRQLLHITTSLLKITTAISNHDHYYKSRQNTRCLFQIAHYFPRTHFSTVSQYHEKFLLFSLL